MPVRSLSSSVLRWPDAQAVDRAVRQWVRETLAKAPDVTRAGYFGSYALGNWGVGSDLDLVIVVDRSEEPFERRPLRWDVTTLPVPTDVLVYTAEEWDSLRLRRLGKTIAAEVVWIYERG